MTVDELLTRLTSRELSEWMAYASIEPFGEQRADLRAALVASVIANANRNPKKQPAAFTPSDFLLFKEQTAPDPDAVAAKAVAILGGPR